MKIRPWRHGLALMLVLVGTGLLLEPSVPSTSDEGAARAQAATLRSTHAWSWKWPAQSLAPTDAAMPISGAERVADGGWLTYPKHPAYIALLSAVLAAGSLGSLILNAGALTGAALLAGDVAHRWWGRSRIQTLWVVGLGTPLVFSVSISWAHTVGVFAATAALWGADRSLSTPANERQLRLLSLAVVFSGLFAAGMFRNEGVLFGLALAAGVGYWALRSPTDRSKSFQAAVVSGTAAVASYATDAAWSSLIRGGPIDGFDTLAEASGLGGKLSGAAHVLIGAGTRSDLGPALAITSLGLAIVVGIVLTLGRRVVGPALAVLAIVSVTGAIVARDDLLTGLATAWPVSVVMVIVLVASHREGTLPTAVRWPLVAMGLFVVAVLATQWNDGGGLEWGGRYLQLGVPLLVAAGLPPLLTRLMELRSQAVLGRLLPAALAVVIAAPTIQSWGALYDLRSRNDDGISFVDSARADLGPATTTNPVILTDIGVLGRMTWRTALNSRMLLARTEVERRAVIASFLEAEVSEFTTITAPDRRHLWIEAVGDSFDLTGDRIDPSTGLAAFRFTAADPSKR